MKNIIKEEINRNRELMGIINESNLLVEKELSRTQRRKLASCAVFGGGFWCAEGAEECASMLESGTDCQCNPDSAGCGDNVVNPNTNTYDKEVMDKETVNEELLTEDKKFRKYLEACRAEVRGGEENSEEASGGGKKCMKFFRKYG